MFLILFCCFRPTVFQFIDWYLCTLYFAIMVPGAALLRFYFKQSGCDVKLLLDFKGLVITLACYRCTVMIFRTRDRLDV